MCTLLLAVFGVVVHAVVVFVGQYDEAVVLGCVEQVANKREREREREREERKN